MQIYRDIHDYMHQSRGQHFSQMNAGLQVGQMQKFRDSTSVASIYKRAAKRLSFCLERYKRIRRERMHLLTGRALLKGVCVLFVLCS